MPALFFFCMGQFTCSNKALVTICLALYLVNCHNIVSIAVPNTYPEI